MWKQKLARTSTRSKQTSGQVESACSLLLSEIPDGTLVWILLDLQLSLLQNTLAPISLDLGVCCSRTPQLVFIKLSWFLFPRSGLSQNNAGSSIWLRNPHPSFKPSYPNPDVLILLLLTQLSQWILSCFHDPNSNLILLSGMLQKRIFPRSQHSYSSCMEQSA